jgi:hypothetical protein
MARTYIEIKGADTVQAYLQSLKSGTAAAGDEVVFVGTDLKYGFGIETGRHRGGRLARRAGGAFYLRDALNSVKATLEADLTTALPHGPEAILRAMTKVGYDVQREAQHLVPVVTGSLRRSIHLTVARR